METSERLFLGLHLYPLFKAEIESVAAYLRPLYPQQKWVNLEHVHFTVHFLGDTTPDQKQKVTALAREIAAATQPFSLMLEKMGAFPKPANPRIVWLGAAAESVAILEELYQRVTAPFIQAGFPVEHDHFTPHATLFRVRRDFPIVWDESVFQFKKTKPQTITELMLFKSVLTPAGSEYIPVVSYPFTK